MEWDAIEKNFLHNEARSKSQGLQVSKRRWLLRYYRSILFHNREKLRRNIKFRTKIRKVSKFVFIFAETFQSWEPRGLEEGERNTYWKKGVTDAFVLAHLNLANSTCKSKTKQWWRLTRVYCITRLRTGSWRRMLPELSGGRPSIHYSVGLSALLVSTYRAMREPRCAERAKDWLHALVVYVSREIGNSRTRSRRYV